MLLWRRPDDTYFRNLLTEQRDKPYTYPKVQGTFGKKDKAACQELIADGYDVDHSRVKLGEGEECFNSAVRAMREWRMHRFSNWVELLFPDCPLQVGETVGVLASHTACYSFSICKIVYTVDELDEDGTVRRFGFAYGTLETHVESGEERFLIEWNRADNSVYYDLLAFSRPSTWFTRLGYPLARRYQASFARDSSAAMRAAVSTRV